jgi:pyruvate/2-oxoacid:ferredoxin oxidoreductase beta subunit
MGMQATSSGRYTEAQMNYFLEAARAEEEFGMSAAFGSGVKVVNVLTGKVTVTK